MQLLSFAIREQNMDEVIKLCAPALEYTPDVLEFYYYMGLAYHQKEKTDEALEVFKKGVNQSGTWWSQMMKSMPFSRA